MKHSPSLLAALVSAGMLAGGIPAAASTAGARVGSLEAIDGGVSINRSPVQKQTVLPVLGRNDVLETTDGHAEMILTPGVFLRLGKDSQARLLNDSITDTRIGLLQGSAILEVDELHKDNHLQVTVADASALVLKTGLYRFDTQPASVEVIKGKAEVQGEDSRVVAKGHRRVALTAQLTESKFGEETNDDLARWSRLRAQYESEASLSSAQYVYDMGWGWGYSNWFWNPWFGTWAWLPGGGYFMNPYGFYFWNPGVVYRYVPYRSYGAYGAGFRHPIVSGAFHSLGRIAPAPAPTMRGGFVGRR